MNKKTKRNGYISKGARKNVSNKAKRFNESPVNHSQITINLRGMKAPLIPARYQSKEDFQKQSWDLRSILFNTGVLPNLVG